MAKGKTRPMEELTRRHAMWIARAMARTDGSPLTANDIVALEEACVPRRVEAGEVLIASGDVVDEVHIVRDGAVHLTVRNPTLGRQTIGLVEPGGVIGDVAVFLGHTMPFDAIADSDTTVLTITRERLLQLLAGSPSLSLRWITSVSKRHDEIQRRLVTLLTKDLSAQIATLLMDHRVEEDGAWMVKMPHQTIAHLLGARRQSVSRVLGQMRRAGLVRSRYGAVEILDLNGVAEAAGLDDLDIEIGLPD